MVKIGYARTSSVGQDNGLETQKAILEELGVEKIFFEKITGKTTKNRKELKACIDYLRKGDTLIVTKIDRLARSIYDLSKLVFQLKDKEVNVQFLKENIIFMADEKANSMNSLMFNVLGAFAQFERDVIVERTSEGRERARQQGKHLGRHPSYKPRDLEKAFSQYDNRETNGLSVSDILKMNGISKSSFYEKLKERQIVFETIKGSSINEAD